MKANSLRSSLALVATSILIGACGGSAAIGDAAEGDDVSIDEALKASVTPGEFKLYAQPNMRPTPSCDPHTMLSLKANSYSTATLEEVVGGSCELTVTPNKRSYRLRLDGEECGSRIYGGSLTKKGVRSTIKITDHRARKCRTLVPAKVIIEETNANGTFVKYSHSAANLIVPADTTSLTLESKSVGGLQLPAGSTCGYGASKYTLDFAKASLAWEECKFTDWSVPLVTKSGVIALEAEAMDAVMTAASAVQSSNSTICGADKPRMSLTVNSPAGTQKYADSFYACQGDGPFVDNLDGLRTALQSVVAGATSPTEITEADDGKTFSFKKGQQVVVVLPSDPMSGSTWSVTLTDRSFGYPVETSGRGTQTFVWDTSNPFAGGEHTVTLSYAAAKSAPTKTFTFTAKVEL